VRGSSDTLQRRLIDVSRALGREGWHDARSTQISLSRSRRRVGPGYFAIAWAQPIRHGRSAMIVPFAAGGPTDVIARVVALKLSESLGQQFYVENQPGAGGNTGTAHAAKSPADGYTILVVSTGFIVNPSLYAKGVPYDPVKDFAPVTLVAASPNVLTVSPSVPAKSVQELIALIRANPGKYSFAQPATGSTPHLNGELFKLAFGSISSWCRSRARRPPSPRPSPDTRRSRSRAAAAISNIKDGKLRRARGPERRPPSRRCPTCDGDGGRHPGP